MLCLNSNIVAKHDKKKWRSLSPSRGPKDFIDPPRWFSNSSWFQTSTLLSAFLSKELNSNPFSHSSSLTRPSLSLSPEIFPRNHTRGKPWRENEHENCCRCHDVKSFEPIKLLHSASSSSPHSSQTLFLQKRRKQLKTFQCSQDSTTSLGMTTSRSTRIIWCRPWDAQYNAGLIKRPKFESSINPTRKSHSFYTYIESSNTIMFKIIIFLGLKFFLYIILFRDYNPLISQLIRDLRSWKSSSICRSSFACWWHSAVAYRRFMWEFARFLV